MAWNDAVITNLGIELLAQAAVGRTLTISSAGLGSGTVSTAALMAQSALKNPLAVSAKISEQKVLENGIKVRIQIKNTGVITAQRMKQVGLFAKIDSGEEVLFAIMQDITGEEIPSEVEYPDFMVEFTSAIAVSNTENIEVTIDSSVFVTKKQLNEELEKKADKMHNHSVEDVSGLAAVATSGKYSDLSGKPTSLPANGGNADTVDGKHAADFALKSEIPTTLPANGGDANTVNGHTVNADVPENAVFTDTTYDAATESASGLVSTTTQNFAGNKFVQAERVGVRIMGFKKGTAPDTTQLAHIQFQDGSGANADSASVGQIFHQIAKDTGASILTLQAVDAMTAGGKNSTTLSLVYDTDNCYVNVSAPSSPARSCLRNLSSGTSAATTSNCPAGAWYGKHA